MDKNLENLGKLLISWWYMVISCHIYIYTPNMIFECVWEYGMPSTYGHLHMENTLHNVCSVDLGGSIAFRFPPHRWLAKLLSFGKSVNKDWWKVDKNCLDRKLMYNVQNCRITSAKLDWERLPHMKNIQMLDIWKPIPISELEEEVVHEAVF